MEIIEKQKKKKTLSLRWPIYEENVCSGGSI